MPLDPQQVSRGPSGSSLSVDEKNNETRSGLECWTCMVPWLCGVTLMIFLGIAMVLLLLLYMESKVEKETVIVHYGIDWPPFQFQSRDGNLTGFNFDIMKEVAKRSGRSFEYIVEDWSAVVDSSGARGGGNGWHVGRLLANKHVDVSPGWAVTTGRSQVFWQGTPWSHPTQGMLYVMQEHESEEIGTFVRTVAALRGWVTDVSTVEKAFHPVGGTILYEGMDEAAQAARVEEVDAIFLTEEELAPMKERGLVPSKTAPNVTLQGVALLSYKGLPGRDIGIELDGFVREIIQDKPFYNKLCEKWPKFPCLTQAQQAASSSAPSPPAP